MPIKNIYYVIIPFMWVAGNSRLFTTVCKFSQTCSFHNTILFGSLLCSPTLMREKRAHYVHWCSSDACLFSVFWTICLASHTHRATATVALAAKTVYSWDLTRRMMGSEYQVQELGPPSPSERGARAASPGRATRGTLHDSVGGQRALVRGERHTKGWARVHLDEWPDIIRY